MNWDFVLSIMTIFLAVIALYQTNQRITSGNKQQLFNRRLNNLVIVKQLLGAYKTNRDLIINEQDVFVLNKLFYRYFTNITYLEGIYDIINNPLNKEQNNVYNNKIKEMEILALESSLIYERKSGKLVSDFILAYKSLIETMHDFQITCNNVYIVKAQLGTKDLDQAKKETGEKEHKKDLLNMINQLDIAYNLMEKNKVEATIIRQLKLSK